MTTLAKYTIHPNGGVVSATLKPFAQAITIRGTAGPTSKGSWIEIERLFAKLRFAEMDGDEANNIASIVHDVDNELAKERAAGVERLAKIGGE